MDEATEGETKWRVAGGGEMGALARSLDWSQTPLGDVAHWPQSLRTAASIVLDSKFAMMIAWGSEFAQIYNDEFRPILGRTKHPALGKPARETYPEAWHLVGPLFQQVMAGEAVRFEDMLVPLDRFGYLEECYFAYSYSPIRKESGGIGGLLVTVAETTARIVAERRLNVLRELGASAHGQSADEAWRAAAQVLERAELDLAFALLYVSETDARSARSITLHASPLAPAVIALDDSAPWPLAKVAAQRSPQLVVDVRARFGEQRGAAWPEAIETALVLPIARAGQEPDGFLIAGLSPRRGFDEHYRNFLQLVADQIATSVGNAEALAHEKRRAEALSELDRQKTSFFSNVSHEFRTPLTLMLGPLADALGTASSIPEQTRRSLEIAWRNAQRLQRLVNDLLDFTRLEAGRLRAWYVPTDLSELTRTLVRLFAAAYERAGLSLTESLPAFDEPVFVDREMWEKIVLNLLSNALKHTFEGGVTVELALDERAVTLSVRDTGVGVAPSELPRLFERFYQVRSARSRNRDGTGIGLSLARELVLLHGGSIEVQSEEGRGTEFLVRLPRGSAHLPQDRVGAASEDSRARHDARPWLVDSAASLGPSDRALSAAKAPSGAARILVVDDNADMREYLARVLSQKFEVELAVDGSAALEAARRRLPDVVLSDVMMPELDGFELTRRLRAEPGCAHLPIVLLSARAGDEATESGLASGADDYLVKPFSARELLARMTTQVALGRARHAETAARTHLQAIFQQAPVAISVVTGPDFVFELTNERYETMVGRTELVGQRFRDAFSELPADAPVFQMLENVRLSGNAFTAAEYPVQIARNGRREEVFFAFSCQPVRGANARVDTILTVAIDVTEQVHNRRALENVAQREEAARRAAEETSRTKDEFLSTLSHELRTPLNAVVGWANLLRSGTIAPEQRDRALETIERNARAQATLIEDLLDLSRIAQGKLVLSVSPVEVVRVVEGALEAVQLAAEAKGVRIQPVLDSHAMIVGDANRLQQIVWNLLSNAIKFTPKGGRVQVRVRRAESHVEVAVADNGMGIEPSFIPHVFERFRQADGGFTRSSGGLGLGLAIVRSLVELHGGLITAASDGLGRGATFTVLFPIAPLRTDAAPPAPSERDAARGSGARFECPPTVQGKRALIVDDEPDTRELLAVVLRQCQVEVTQAANAAEAVAFLERERFDVLISDIGMPAEDGMSFLRKVRRLPAEAGGRIPALALTAYARSEDRNAVLKAGFQMHLSKPVEPMDLVVAVATLLGGYTEH